MSLFLTPEELAELTGIRKGKCGKSRHQLQIAQLRQMGVPFYVNACGRPVVAYAAIAGGKPGQQEKTQSWTPAIVTPA